MSADAIIVEQDDDCPFGEPGPLPEQAVIGICPDCGADAHIKLHGLTLCYPCAYNRANW